jgi:hypothetical protein
MCQWGTSFLLIGLAGGTRCGSVGALYPEYQIGWRRSNTFLDTEVPGNRSASPSNGRVMVCRHSSCVPSVQPPDLRTLDLP